MSLSPEQRSEATRLQRRGLTLREIARAIGASYQDVSLWLYGGVADWAPPAVNSQAKATGAEPPLPLEPVPAQPPPTRIERDPTTLPNNPHGPVERREEVREPPPRITEAVTSNPWDAERERLAAEHPAAQRFFLKSPDGQFLHESTRVLTRMPRFYWRGTAEQLRALREKEPSWPTLFPVPCP